MNKNDCLVYRHIRLDNNKVFYIGISNNMRRPFRKDKRNKFWVNIVNKTDYIVEIISKGLSWEDACELEILLIQEYGRRNLGLGELVNLTDGGDGMINHRHTEESKKKMSVASSNKLHSIETKEKIKDNNPNKKLVLNFETGIFYDSLVDAALSINMKITTLGGKLRGVRPNETSLRYV